MVSQRFLAVLSCPRAMRNCACQLGGASPDGGYTESFEERTYVIGIVEGVEEVSVERVYVWTSH